MQIAITQIPLLAKQKIAEEAFLVTQGARNDVFLFLVHTNILWKWDLHVIHFHRMFLAKP